MQDELFLLEHYEEVAVLAELPEGSPEREEATQRLWELARKDDSPWCAEAMDAPGREGLFSNRRAGLLVAALGLAIVLGMYGLDRLGVDPRVSFALGTLGLISLAAGAALCNARFKRSQEQSFRNRLDGFLARASALPPERLAHLSELFAAPQDAAGQLSCGCVHCGHIWPADPSQYFPVSCPKCGNKRFLFIAPGKELTPDDLRDIRALLP